MSPEVRFTEAARWQLRASIERLQRTSPEGARGFLDRVGVLLRDPQTLRAAGQPIVEFPQLPTREVRIEETRIFFRDDGSTLWISGVWRT